MVRGNNLPAQSLGCARPFRARHLPRAPLPCERYYLREGGVDSRLGQSYLTIIAHTSSCVRPNASARLRSPPCRPVFAGCYEPLLTNGPSRRYLRHPCAGAWTPTPSRFSGAFTRFFPKNIGLTIVISGSARKTSLQRNSERGSISRLQSFHYVQAPTLTRPPDCAHRTESMPRKAAKAVYTTRWTNRYRFELWYRYASELGPMTRQDLHLLDGGLVGRYRSPIFFRINFDTSSMKIRTILAKTLLL